MEINIPDLKPHEILQFSNIFRDLDLNQDYVLNFGSTVCYYPFPMLVTSSLFRRWFRAARKSNPRGNYTVRNCISDTYPQHMGFFRAFGFNLGKYPGEVIGNTNYLQINRIKMAALESEAMHNYTSVQDTLYTKAKSMAKVLSHTDAEMGNPVAFMLLEMFRNIPEHSEATEIWYCAQYWPKRDLIELAIMDEGCGVTESMKRNQVYERLIDSDKKAIEMALMPGVSRTFDPGRAQRNRNDDGWENSGYGLYVASNICAQLGGEFILLSGNSAICLKKEGDIVTRKSFDTYFPGTAIQLQVKASEIKNYKEIHRKIISEGQRLAKCGENAFATASKPSKGIFE